MSENEREDLMTEENKTKKELIEKKEKNLGFLAVIITLLVPIITEALNSVKDVVWIDALSMYLLCILYLFLIWIFFILKQFKKYDLAINYADALFLGTPPILLFAAIIPIIPHLYELYHYDFGEIIYLSIFILLFIGLQCIWTCVLYEYRSKKEENNN